MIRESVAQIPAYREEATYATISPDPVTKTVEVPEYVLKERVTTKPVVILQQRVLPHAKRTVEEKTYNIRPMEDDPHRFNGKVHAYSFVDSGQRFLKPVQLDVVMYMRIPEVHEEANRGRYVVVPPGTDLNRYMPTMSNDTLQVVLLDSFLRNQEGD